MGPGLRGRTERAGLSRRAGCVLKAAILVALVVPVVGMKAQSAFPTPAPPDKPYVLHVYEDLIEVPTLVLTSRYVPVPNLDARSFWIRLDSGRPFQPAAERLEGNDPLEVAVLVDASGAVPDALVGEFARALPPLAQGTLNSADHITVYAVDCALLAGAQVGSSSGAEALRGELASVLANPGLHQQSKGQAGCTGSRHLWDAMGTVAERLRNAPKRRVLLVLTNGVDHGSRGSWEEVRAYASGLSVAVFAIRPPVASPGLLEGNPPVRPTREDPLFLLCAGSGGMRMMVGPRGVQRTLQLAFELIRQRYVLYFPRPANDTAGRHSIDVTVQDNTAIVRPTGVTFPPPDMLQKANPSTVPNAPGRAPELGSRRILQPETPR